MGTIQMRNGAEIKKWYFFFSYQAALWGWRLTGACSPRPAISISLCLHHHSSSVGFFSDSSAFFFTMSATSLSPSVFMPGSILIILGRVSLLKVLCMPNITGEILESCAMQVFGCSQVPGDVCSESCFPDRRQ